MNDLIRNVDRVEITSLQDNYVDVLAMDSDGVVARPLPVAPAGKKGLVLTASPLAEHGFSAFIRVADPDGSRCMLFDFGGSGHGAAYNADLLSVDLGAVEAMALSHGHADHFRGLETLVRKTGKDGLPLALHPAVFRKDRYMKVSGGLDVFFPELERDWVEEAGAAVRETTSPMPLLGGRAVFLGEIPRTVEFETGMSNAFYKDGDRDLPDRLEDDSAIVFHVRDRGLVVLSGCAHSGIVNTVQHACDVAGTNRVMAVMGGFHLTGPDGADRVEPTIQALKAIDPEFVIPAHCTCRDAVMAIEKAMPDKFRMNMSGTTMTFGS